MIITLRHARALNYCSKGMRYWFERRNINYMDFVKNGIDEEVFLSSGDTMAIKVVEYIDIILVCTWLFVMGRLTP
jgi:hypothetical protein